MADNIHYAPNRGVRNRSPNIRIRDRCMKEAMPTVSPEHMGFIMKSVDTVGQVIGRPSAKSYFGNNGERRRKVSAL
jgi:hypothetical protein